MTSSADRLDSLNDKRVVRIHPGARSWSETLTELLEHRELLYFLTWRDVKVRYKQTVLGTAWAVLQPLTMMVIFSLFFGRLAKMPSNGVSYPLFALAALVPWQFFAHSLGESSNSLVQNERLVTKTYLPRLILPMSSLGSGLLDFAISFALLLTLVLIGGIVPGLTALTIPLFLLLATVTALGLGLWLAALNVQYRDVRYTLAFLTQIWLFMTPIAYPSSLVPARWQAVYGLNPMAGVVEGFRWALLGTPTPSFRLLGASSSGAVLLLISGFWYFRRMERTFADTI